VKERKRKRDKYAEKVEYTTISKETVCRLRREGCNKGDMCHKESSEGRREGVSSRGRTRREGNKNTNVYPLVSMKCIQDIPFLINVNFVKYRIKREKKVTIEGKFHGNPTFGLAASKR